MTRLINLLLVVVIIAGIVRLRRQQRELAEVTAEHGRLAAMYGALPVKDPSKYLITRIETGEPRHYLWRCYFPAITNLEKRAAFADGGKISGSYTSSDAREDLVRCRFELDTGVLTADLLGSGGGSRFGYGGKELSAFFFEHWDELDVELLAADGTVEVPTDQVLPFVTIRIPDALIEKLPERSRRWFSRDGASSQLFYMLYGTKEAFAAYDRNQQSGSP